MADYKSDEEYQFSEPETPVAYTTEPDQTKKDKDFQNRRKSRNLILMFAILMAFWAVYKFMGMLLSQKQVSSKPVASVQQPVTHAKPLPVQPSLSAAQIEEISNQKALLNKLESEITTLQTTLSDVNTKLGDLSNQVNNLASQVNKPPVVVEVKKPIRSKKRPLMGKHKPYISYSYRLEAAIPGRAWIMRSDGANLTVSLGDSLSGYGTVVSIDPNEGVVQMSSGTSIKYKSH